MGGRCGERGWGEKRGMETWGLGEGRGNISGQTIRRPTGWRFSHRHCNKFCHQPKLLRDMPPEISFQITTIVQTYKQNTLGNPFPPWRWCKNVWMWRYLRKFGKIEFCDIWKCAKSIKFPSRDQSPSFLVRQIQPFNFYAMICLADNVYIFITW